MEGGWLSAQADEQPIASHEARSFGYLLMVLGHECRASLGVVVSEGVVSQLYWFWSDPWPLD
jgi:hypothetical protein